MVVSGRFLPQNVRPDRLDEEEFTGFWTDDAKIPAAPASGHVCVMLAFDIMGFTRKDRDQEVRIHLHKVLYAILRQAAQIAGLPWDLCHHEDRGDGALVVLPPGVFAHGVINPFPEQLRNFIRLHNRMSSPAARLQVRAAAHTGTVYRDGHGLVGDDINLLFRMLNARPLRTALTGSDGELAFAISEFMYDKVVRRHPTLADPALFRPMNTTVKGTRVKAWRYVPGVPLPLSWTRPGTAYGTAGKGWDCASRASRTTASVQASGATEAGAPWALTISGSVPSLVRCAASHERMRLAVG